MIHYQTHSKKKCAIKIFEKAEVNDVIKRKAVQREMIAFKRITIQNYPCI